MSRLALTGSLVLIAVTLAYAQVANPPTYAVGDTWTWTDRGPELGEEVRIVKVEDGGRRVAVRSKSTCPRCQWVSGLDLTLIEVLDADGKAVDASQFGFIGVGFKFYDFPLQVKKTWRIEGYGSFRGNNVPYVIDSTVSDYKDVKTKAGTFKAFQIDRNWKIKVSAGPPPTWSDTAWWSPEVKTVIKYESGARNGRSWELVSYSVKP